MRHHRQQRDPALALRHWRHQLGVSLPVLFRKDLLLPQPQLRGWFCEVPPAYWQADLDTLNALFRLVNTLGEVRALAGEPGQANLSGEWDAWEGNDVGESLTSLLTAIDLSRDKLRTSGGRLGKLLRGHWPVIEQGYHPFKLHLLACVLSHRTGQAYVLEFSETFRQHLASWGVALNLLWLELEEQSR